MEKDIHLTIRQDNFCNTANHGNEIKYVPGITEIILQKEEKKEECAD